MLFHRFHDEIYRFATRRVGDPALGQDVAADTFADAFGAIHRFRWKGVPFEAWLYTIARRRIADHLRVRARSTIVGDMPERAGEDETGSILDGVHVRALLASLSEADRELLELRFMEDLDVEQTALRLGKSEGAVRVAQHRALGKLRAAAAEGAA
jgi:RNA polymerase sigma-70 factor (ECF subfamily)